MRPRAAIAAAALLALASCRTAGPALVPADSAVAAHGVSAVLSARDRAWAPRRFKALFKGEVVPNAGVSVRGYLALFWDGETLIWRASVPLGGAGRTGTVRRSGGDSADLFPGRLAAGDLLSAILGVPEEAPTGEGAVVRGERLQLTLPSGDGRSVLVSPSGEVTGLVLPSGVRVELQPGTGLPRRIDVRGPEGRALLTLESYGPWPEGEEAPRG